MDKFPHTDRCKGGRILALFGMVNYKVPCRMDLNTFLSILNAGTNFNILQRTTRTPLCTALNIWSGYRKSGKVLSMVHNSVSN